MLTVLNVAYPCAPVGPDAVGGAEQILGHLDQALVAVGHRSIVVACAGSVTAGELIATPAVNGELSEDVRRRVRREHLANIERALNEYPVDLIHFHGVDFYEYLPPAGVPVLVTLHLPPEWYPHGIFRLGRAETYLHCVSESQRRSCPPGARLLDVIENGVPVEALAARCTKRRYAMAMGRICPEKNFHVALDAGARAGVPVLLAGEAYRYESHERYFRERIVPRLDGMRRYIGPVGFARKRRLLAAARCLLSASLAPETSSLVAMEALSCGTPVIAFPSGALPEIVEHGVTGFLVHDEGEMAEAIVRAGELDPEMCRETAGRRFSLGRMVERYFSVYREVAGRGGDVGTRRLGECGMRSAECGMGTGGGEEDGGAEGRRDGGTRGHGDTEKDGGVWVEEITALSGLEAIREEWGELWARVSTAAPFQTPEWLIPWWEHVGEGDLLTLAVREAGSGGRLVGLAPMYVHTRAGSGKRELFLLGVATTDYLGGLFEPGWERAGAEAVFARLEGMVDRWDVCDFQQLRTGAVLLEASAPEGWESEVTLGEPCQVLDLPGSPEELGERLPGKMWRNLRYYRRRAERTGELWIGRAEGREAEESLEALIRLHGTRWRQRGQAGVLADAGVQRAHREALPGLLRRGLLRMYGLRLDGRIVAVLYGLADRPDVSSRRHYCYLSGFDPEWESLSPGTLIMGHAIEEAAREGAMMVDFLRGQEAYKRLWGLREVPVYRRRMWHGNRGPGQVGPTHAFQEASA